MAERVDLRLVLASKLTKVEFVSDSCYIASKCSQHHSHDEVAHTPDWAIYHADFAHAKRQKATQQLIIR